MPENKDQYFTKFEDYLDFFAENADKIIQSKSQYELYIEKMNLVKQQANSNKRPADTDNEDKEQISNKRMK